MTTILGIDLLPFNPYSGTEIVALVITSSVPSYYKMTGIGLDRIVHIDWYPSDPGSVVFDVRQFIASDDTYTSGTFMIKVLDNYLNADDRGGRISARLDDGTTISFPVKTLGPVSTGRLWQSPYEGLSTGN